MMSASGARNRSPFTATQWQELEQQALIFKYMVTGTPIPPDLIYSIKRSLDSSLSSRLLFPHHPIGWGCFEMGFGRKVDPEPGRCRRTDGKKWRCSKEAYPDSKYCERHMHRGRNRSRKPVELVSSTSTTQTTSTINNSTNNSNVIPSYNNRNNFSSITNPINMPSASSFSFSPLASESYPNSSSSSLNPFFYTQSTTSNKPHDSDFSPHDDATTHQLFMDSGSYSHDEKDFRHIHGMRECVDERAFFPEASSGSARSCYSTDSYQQLSMNSYKSYSNSQFQNINNNNNDNNRNDPRQQEHHCFVLGTDFKSNRPNNKEKESDETTQQRPLHHFFGEWPLKNTDSWLDLASNSRIPSDE